MSTDRCTPTSVAVFTDTGFDKSTGLATTLKAVLESADEVAPRIYTTGDLDQSTIDFFSPDSFGFDVPGSGGLRVYWPPLSVFERELHARGVDVVHIATPGPTGLAGRVFGRRLGLPVVGSYHSHLSDYAAIARERRRAGVLIDRYVRWCYAPCRPILVPSSATSAVLAGRGYPSGQLAMWPQGVDTDGFSPARVSYALRQKWHVDPRRPAIVCAGRLSRENGLALFGEIQRGIRRHGIDHQLIFAGGGPMRGELEERCPDAIFTGEIPPHQLAVTMASADLLLAPGTADTLGRVILEAQASGLPVIVPDRGGAQEHMLPDRTGIVCASGDPVSFAAAAVQLIAHPAVRSTMASAARAYAIGRRWQASLEPLFGAWRRAAASAAAARRARPKPPAAASMHPHPR